MLRLQPQQVADEVGIDVTTLLTEAKASLRAYPRRRRDARRAQTLRPGPEGLVIYAHEAAPQAHRRVVPQDVHGLGAQGFLLTPCVRNNLLQKGRDQADLARQGLPRGPHAGLAAWASRWGETASGVTWPHAPSAVLTC